MKKSLLVLIVAFALLISGCDNKGPVANGSDDATETIQNEEKVYSFEGGVGTFYYPDEIYNDYLTVEREFDGTAQNVIDILYELGNYSEKITVNSYYVQGNTMYIDFGLSLIKAAHGGSAKEFFVILGTCNTLISCFKVEYVRFTVEGNDLVTAHADYTEPVPFKE